MYSTTFYKDFKIKMVLHLLQIRDLDTTSNRCMKMGIKASKLGFNMEKLGFNNYTTESGVLNDPKGKYEGTRSSLHYLPFGEIMKKGSPKGEIITPLSVVS